MNKCAFISGASRGIGRGIAKALSKQGYNLALTCVNNHIQLEEYAKSLEDEYNNIVRTYKLDVSLESDWKNVTPIIYADLGAIDVVINNAGMSYIGLITDMTSEEWNRIVATNLSSLYYSTKAFLPTMIKNKSGHIINISSIWGRVGASCEVAYSATKGAVDAYTRSLAKEVAPSHVSVNAIACGVIDTDMNACFREEEMAAIIDDIPACRLGTPEEVGEMVVSMLNAPTYMTGQVIGIDGAM